MTDEKSLAKKPNIAMADGILAPSNLEEAIRFATMLTTSKLVPKDYQGADKIGDVIVAMQWGAELKMSPLASLQNIAIINGRPSVYGDTLMAIGLSHPDVTDIVETFAGETMTATCIVKRRDKEDVVRNFSRADAERAQLWGKGGPWKQYPERMLQMRARGFAIRDACADALRGMCSAEEQHDIVDAREPLRSTPVKKEDLGAEGLVARLQAEANTPELELGEEPWGEDDVRER